MLLIVFVTNIVINIIILKRITICLFYNKQY